MSISYAFSVLCLVLIALLAVGSLVNLSSHPHWFVRGWDFPRVQIVVITWLIAIAYLLARRLAGTESVASGWMVFVLVVLITLWHGFRILPYTPLLPKQAASTPEAMINADQNRQRAIRLVMTNVEMENDQYGRWMETIRDVDPDVLLVVETDSAWLEAIESLTSQFPYQIARPQDNWYGMLLLSKLPIVDSKVRYLVQQDVPSIDARLRMDDGTTFRFVGVHPRPPEPIRNNDSTARDAELTLWGAELKDDSGPVIIGGDLNDVAWSKTTRLFLRTSGLLDPRRGRGFFNTFHANRWYMRFPLDHIFHSRHFTISKLDRLDEVGSDHFPILIDLHFTPAMQHHHDVLHRKNADDEEINERVQRAVDDDDLQGQAVDEGKPKTIEQLP